MSLCSALIPFAVTPFRLCLSHEVPGDKVPAPTLKTPVMFDPRRLDDLLRRATAGLPPDAAVVKEDLSKNLRSFLESSLARMDLVTREEFEVQRAVLQRTREKLEALEKRLSEIEDD